MVSYLDFCYYFEVNGQNHILFRLLQVLKEKHSMTFEYECERSGSNQNLSS